MNLFEDFQFLRPLWLLLIPACLVLWWQLKKLDDPLRGWRRKMEPGFLQALVVGEDSNASVGRRGLFVVWLLTCLSLAGPTWKPEPLPFADDPVATMIVLSASETMNESDLTPSRMERARLKVADLANKRKGEPVGLIAFAGSAHLVMPPTRDTSVIVTMANEISPKIMPVIGDDLVAALKLAQQSMSNKPGAIVVVADELSEQTTSLREFARVNTTSVQFLAIAETDSPNLESIYEAAKTVGGSVTEMSIDSSDIRSVVRKISMTPVAVSTDGEVRWAESGWWLVPVIAVLSVLRFRKEQIDD